MLKAIPGFLLLATLAGSGLAAQDGGKPRLAVLPLKGEGKGVVELRDQTYQKVTDAFLVTRHFDLVERAQMGAVVGEAKLQNSGLVDDATAASMGKLLGVKYVVVGSYMGTMTQSVETFQGKKGPVTNYSYPCQMTVNLRLVSVESGRIEETFEAVGAAKANQANISVSRAMADLSVKLNREVSNKFPVSGYLIKVVNDVEAIIDMGKKDGVAVGDLFYLVERGEDIVHPVTHKIIKGSKKVLTELKITSVDDETSTVKVSGSKVPLKVGLILESAPKKAGFWESLGDSLKK